MPLSPLTSSSGSRPRIFQISWLQPLTGANTHDITRPICHLTLALMEGSFNHLLHGLINIPQVTSSAAFSIATAANAPLPNPVGVDGFSSSIMTSPSPTAMATAAGSPKGGDDQTECRLLGSFALFVQLALGGLAMLSLVYKRWRERPQRPVKIWFFDVSKQVFGSVLVHAANVFMSMLTSGRFSVTVEPASVATVQAVSGMLLRRMASGDDAPPPDDEFTPNPCSFYLLNLAIDVRCSPALLCLFQVLFHFLMMLTHYYRQHSASPSSSSSSAYSLALYPTRASANRQNRSSPATTATRLMCGGG